MLLEKKLLAITIREFCCPLFFILVDNQLSCRTSYPFHRIEITNRSVESKLPREQGRKLHIVTLSDYYQCRPFAQRRDTVSGFWTRFSSGNCQCYRVCNLFRPGADGRCSRDRVKMIPVDDYPVLWSLLNHHKR